MFILFKKELCTRMVKLGNNVTCLNRSGHHVSGNEFDSHNGYDGIIKCRLYSYNTR